jgi:dTDP-4-dehydrorhamnose reductase
MPYDKRFAENKYYAAINCAAYTAVDKAEGKKKAYLINETGAVNLAKAAHDTGAKFVHISTDFIFDGTHSTPILEEDKPNPLSVYGASKLAAEIAVLDVNPNTMLFRTSWVYSSYGANFVKTILKLCRERESLNVIFDQIGTPTYARDSWQVSYSPHLIKLLIKKYQVFSISAMRAWRHGTILLLAIGDIAGLRTKTLPNSRHHNTLHLPSDRNTAFSIKRRLSKPSR